MRRAAVLLAFTGCLVVGSAFAEEPGPVLEPWREAAAPLDSELKAAPEPSAKPERLVVPIDPLAVPKPDPVEPAPAEELNLGWTLLRTVLVLGIVILSIYITLNFGLRRLLGIASVPRGPGVVQVVERIPLDQKRAMFVIRAAGEYLLIGGGDGALQLIAKLDPAEVEKLQNQQPPSLTLSPLVAKLLKRREVPAPPAPGDNS